MWCFELIFICHLISILPRNFLSDACLVYGKGSQTFMAETDCNWSSTVSWLLVGNKEFLISNILLFVCLLVTNVWIKNIQL